MEIDSVISILVERTQRLREDIESGVSEQIYRPFLQSAIRILDLCDEEIKRLQSTKDIEVKKGYMYTIDERLRAISEDYTLYQLSNSSRSEGKNWRPLYGFIQFLSRKLKIDPMPIPLFSERCYSASPYKHYSANTLRGAAPDYHFIACDRTFSPFSWPLLAHEAFHCITSKKSWAEDFAYEEGLFNGGLNYDNIVSRIDESMCDLLSCRLFGPPYLFSFASDAFSSLSYEEDTQHPSDYFRINLMIDAIIQMGFSDEIENFKKAFNAAYQERRTTDSISSSRKELIEFTLSQAEDFDPANLLDDTTVENFLINPPSNVITLFSGVWSLVENGNISLLSVQDFHQLSGTLLQTLERITKPSHTH